MTPVSTIRRPNALTDGTVPTVHQDSPRTTRSRLGAAVLRFRAGWWCVLGGVLLSRTLAGAVPSALSGLAIRVRDGAGRFPVAVTTETAVGSAVPSRVVDSVVWCGRPPAFAAAHPGVVGGWVGCGPYSGRFALSCCLPHPAPVVRWVGGCCLCRPISTSQLEAVTGLPLLAYQPSSLLGAYQEGRVLLVETLS